MNKQNLAYIANLKIEDVPWSRLTTAYGRASGFPEIFKQLSAAIGEKNLTQSLTTSKSNSGQNMANPVNNNEAKFNAKAACDVLDKIFKEIEHQSTFWHATPFALVFLARIFMRAKLVADNGGKNEMTELIVPRLGEFLASMLMVCVITLGFCETTTHHSPFRLASFSSFAIPLALPLNFVSNFLVASFIAKISRSLSNFAKFSTRLKIRFGLS